MKNIIALLLVSVCATAQNIPFYGNLTPADSTGYDLGRSSLHWDTVYYNVLIPAVGSASDTSLWQRLGLTRIEPKGQRSVTIDKSLHVGDDVGTDSVLFLLDLWVNEVDSTIHYNNKVYRILGNDTSQYSVAWISDDGDSTYSFTASMASVGSVLQFGRYKYQYGAWDSATGGAGYPYSEISVYDTFTSTDFIRARVDTSFGFSITHDSIVFQVDQTDNVFIGTDSNISVIRSTGVVNIGAMNRSQGILRMREDADNGSNGISLQARSSLAYDFTLELPADSGASGQVLTRTGSNGATQWDSFIGWDTLGTNFFGGISAGASLTGTSLRNTFGGISAGTSVSTGDDNLFIGYQAGDAVTIASFNTALGSGALGAETNGSGNVAVGYRAGFVQNGGGNNTLVGQSAGLAISTGSSNNLIGNSSGSSVTTGSSNICIGTNAGVNINTGSNNLYIGTGTGSAIDASSSIGLLGFTTASNQIVIGGASATINDLYMGDGVTSLTPSAISIQPTGESGNNQSGVNIKIRSGAATGNATGGTIELQTSDPGASGTTLQTYSTKLSIRADGVVVFSDMPSDSTGLPAGALYYDVTGTVLRKF